jgi:hypothetical protein
VPPGGLEPPTVGEFAIARGELVRDDHPAGLANRKFFVEAGLSDMERATAVRDRELDGLGS